MNSKDNNKEGFSKVSISWYPGHMAKTRRQISEDLKLVDIVIEILDARIPLSSRNPDINKIVANKKRLLVLNKSDLADEKQNVKWIKYFKDNNIEAVLVDSKSGKGINESLSKIKSIYSDEQSKFDNKGRVGKSIRIMVIGIPNVGKSSYINRLTKKTSAKVGNKPGVTTQKQWIKVDDTIELMDTPGVLWPKFESEEVGLNLSYTGTIKDDVIEPIEVGFQLLKKLCTSYRKNICERYKLEEEYINYVFDKDLEENEKVLEIMHEIGRKRGALISGGNINEEKTAQIILDDFRSGNLGRITLETI